LLDRDDWSEMRLQRYAKLRDLILEQIRSQQLGPGDPLPAERTLALDHDLARMTVRRAIDLLVRDGFLDRRHGSGTYVAPFRRIRKLVLFDDLTGEVKLIYKTKATIDKVSLNLSQNENRPVSRPELLREVWGYKNVDFIETRTVDIHVTKLRRKIEVDPARPQLLVTVRGEGYQLQVHP